MALTTQRNEQGKRLRRPTKTGTAKRYRELVHRRRLFALGVAEERLHGLTTAQIRELLREPAKVERKLKKLGV